MTTSSKICSSAQICVKFSCTPSVAFCFLLRTTRRSLSWRVMEKVCTICDRDDEIYVTKKGPMDEPCRPSRLSFSPVTCFVLIFRALGPAHCLDAPWLFPVYLIICFLLLITAFFSSIIREMAIAWLLTSIFLGNMIQITLRKYNIMILTIYICFVCLFVYCFIYLLHHFFSFVIRES